MSSWKFGPSRSGDPKEEAIKSRLRVLVRTRPGAVVSLQGIKDLLSGHILYTPEELVEYGLKNQILSAVVGQRNHWQVAQPNGSDPPPVTGQVRVQESPVAKVPEAVSVTSTKGPGDKKKKRHLTDPRGAKPGKMARHEDRQSALERWLVFMRKEYRGQIVTRDTFLKHMPVMFDADPSTWTKEAILRATDRQIIESVSGKTGEWKVTDNNYVPGVEANNSGTQKEEGVPDDQSGSKVQEVPVVEAVTHPNQKEGEETMAGPQAQKQMTLDRFYKLAHGPHKVSDLLAKILKQVFILCGMGVVTYRDLNGKDYGYGNSTAEWNAFTQRFVAARSLGIMIRTDKDGNPDSDAKGWGRFVEEMVPIEWIREREERIKSTEDPQKPKALKVPVLPPKPAAPPSLPPPQATSSDSVTARQVEPLTPLPVPASAVENEREKTSSSEVVSQALTSSHVSVSSKSTVQPPVSSESLTPAVVADEVQTDSSRPTSKRQSSKRSIRRLKRENARLRLALARLMGKVEVYEKLIREGGYAFRAAPKNGRNG